MSFNVLGSWRFCGCDKGNRRFPATAKMWWSKIPQRRLRRLVFCGTRAAEQAAQQLPFVKRSCASLSIFFRPFLSRPCTWTYRGVSLIFILFFFVYYILLFYSFVYIICFYESFINTAEDGPRVWGIPPTEFIKHIQTHLIFHFLCFF